jgi:hypothetical protein
MQFYTVQLTLQLTQSPYRKSQIFNQSYFIKFLLKCLHRSKRTTMWYSVSFLNTSTFKFTSLVSCLRRTILCTILTCFLSFYLDNTGLIATEFLIKTDNCGQIYSILFKIVTQHICLRSKAPLSYSVRQVTGCTNWSFSLFLPALQPGKWMYT